MARTRFVSVAFQQGIKQNVPKTLLPVPLLTEAKNLIVEKEGRLQSRPNMKKLSKAGTPINGGTPIKLFSDEDQLFLVTDKNFLNYVRSWG